MMIVALSAVMVISAATIYTITIDQSGTVLPSGAVKVYFNSVNYTNGQSASLDWATVSVGTNNRDVIVYNDYNAAVIPSITPSGLPSGWQLTLSDTSSVAPHSSSTRTLVLTVPSDALAGPYSWSATFDAAIP